MLFGSPDWVTIIWSSCSNSFLLVSSSSDTLFISRAKSLVLIFSLAISSESTCLTSVWNGIEGSSNVDTCLTCRLWAKYLTSLVILL